MTSIYHIPGLVLILINRLMSVRAYWRIQVLLKGHHGTTVKSRIVTVYGTGKGPPGTQSFNILIQQMNTEYLGMLYPVLGGNPVQRTSWALRKSDLHVICFPQTHVFGHFHLGGLWSAEELELSQWRLEVFIAWPSLLLTLCFLTADATLMLQAPAVTASPRWTVTLKP